jgi:hypothetical protein
MSATADLATFVSSFDCEAVPAAVVHEAKRAFLNALGCALGGARDPATELLWSSLAPFAGAPGSSLLGRSERTDALTAALVNGYASNILDFDDTHLATVIHPGPPMLSPLLALAESMPAGLPSVSGAELLEAFMLGMEVACRLGVAIGPGHYARGWHITGTCGTVGVAAACGRLLRLEPDRMAHALGIAATSASGLGEMLGGMSKSYNIARPCREGLTAALLASRGFTSSLRVLEAPRGFAAVMADGLDENLLTGGLGTRWEIADDSYKPFPCGIVLHPLIDGCLQLAIEHDIRAEQIDSIEATVHPLVMTLTGRTAPKNGLESKLSFTHACAVPFTARQAGVHQFTDACAADAQVAQLRTRVSSIVDPTIGTDQARIRVRLDGGTSGERVVERWIEHSIGSFDNPMSDAALDAKFISLATEVLTHGRARALLDACHGIQAISDARELVALARPMP